ncbi:FG-GAP-like repeat-containing protein, partial [Acuticoccus sediminis]|uniref:FG-GAP-like repeat-containing protein n=1 Tax=Acuticoccus sediminis TaxID=2184697 RepID=UPI001CFC5E68
KLLCPDMGPDPIPTACSHRGRSIADQARRRYMGSGGRLHYWGDLHGTAWADFDNDGDQDVIILLGGTGTPSGGEKNQLLLNENGRLDDVAEAYRIQYPKASGRDVAWFDYDRDGLLDFYNTAVYRTEDSSPGALFHQKPAGFFVNVDDIVGATTVEDYVQSLFFGDVTDDGILDFMTEDHKIFDGATGPRFKALETLQSPTTARDILIADFDGDLKNDVYSATQEMRDEKIFANRLFLNSPSGLTDATNALGLSGHLYSTRSAVAADFDNDMDVDIFLLNGVKYGELHDNKAYPNVMLWNDGTGHFLADEELGNTIGWRDGPPLSVTTTDYDRDGFLDMFLEYDHTTDRLIRNEGNGNHWIEIDLKGRDSNRDGIGSLIFVTAGGKTQLRDVTAGTHGQWSQNEKIVHVGLAGNDRIDRIEVHWTNGIVQELTDIAANQVLTIVEQRGSERRTGTAGDDEIAGNGKSDVLHGGTGDDVLRGLGGKDILSGDDGDDTLDGHAGADLLDGGRGADVVWGRAGFDTVDYSMSLPDVQVDIGQGGVGTGGDADGDRYHGIDGIIGSAGDDVLRGNNGGNHLRGGNGDDDLHGMTGNDLLWGGPGHDRLDGGDGHDFASYSHAATGVRAQLNGRHGTGEAAGDVFISVEGLIGSKHNDILVGNGLNNQLSGNAGDDRLFGGKGVDVLRGNPGADFLVGGSEADIFRFRSVRDSNAVQSDWIDDFEKDLDRMDVSQIDAVASSRGNQAFTFIGTSDFSNTAGELRFEHAGHSRTIIQGDIDGDRAADLIILLDGVVNLSEADFEL